MQMPELFKRTAGLNNSRQVKDWVRNILNLSDDYSVLITELKCTEPGCPPIETVIAVLGPDGERYQRKAHLAIREITEADAARLGLELKQSMEMKGRTETKEECDDHH